MSHAEDNAPKSEVTPARVGSGAWFASLPWTDVDMRLYRWESTRQPPITYHYRGNGDFEEIEARCGKASARWRLTMLAQMYPEARAQARLHAIKELSLNRGLLEANPAYQPRPLE